MIFVDLGFFCCEKFEFSFKRFSYETFIRNAYKYLKVLSFEIVGDCVLFHVTLDVGYFLMKFIEGFCPRGIHSVGFSLLELRDMDNSEYITQLK